MNSLPDNWPENMKPFKGAADFTKKLRKHGARVIIITSIFSKSGPFRLKNLADNGIEFDEAYFTKGAEKSAFAKQLIKRFAAKDGTPPRSILVDDMMRNCTDFVENVPSSVAFSLSYPYNDPARSAAVQRGQQLPIFFLPDVKSLYKAVVSYVRMV